MKKLISIFFLTSGFMLFISCKNSDKKENSSEGSMLFQKSVAIYKTYTDSLVIVNDSSSFFRLLDEFDRKLTQLNYEFPPDTDLLMTEDESDSLIKLAKTYTSIREKRNTEFQNSNFHTVDSLNDSIVKNILPSI